jgi:hypothetical protein
MTQAVALAQQASTGVSPGFKNRIINGAMTIDQRNAGASGTASGYTVDRWQYAATQASKGTWQQNAGSVTAPAGFTNYLGFTSSSAYSVGATDYFYIVQYIEGYNMADLNWGSANAKTVTLSAWVRSSLTGTFGGSLVNWNGNYSYPFSYTISSANTWTQISVTITGPTAGTWAGATNAGALQVYFSLGTGSTYSGTAGSWSANYYGSATGATSVVGTNGATFYITGCQLEVGSTATSFDYLDYGRSLIQCQRYFQTWLKGTGTGTLPYWGSSGGGTTGVEGPFALLQQMRTTPTYTINALELYDGGASTYVVTAVVNFGSSNQTPRLGFSVASGLTSNRLYYVLPSNINAYFFASAEL